LFIADYDSSAILYYSHSQNFEYKISKGEIYTVCDDDDLDASKKE